MLDIEITTNADEVAASLAQTGEALEQVPKTALRDLLGAAEDALRAELTGGTLHRRSGRLAESVRSRLVETSDGVSVEAYAGIGYAGILRRGGSITATRARLLAIPAPGAPVSNARRFLENPQQYGYVRAFMTMRAILGVREDESTEAVFFRVAGVRIPARDFAEPAARQLEPIALERVTDGVRTVLDGAGR